MPGATGPPGPAGATGATGPQGEPGGPPRILQDEGTTLPGRTILNIVGAGVTATDDPAGDRTVLTIPGNTVSNVFGRQGAIVAQAGDYAAAQVTNAVSMIGSYADPGWITSLAYSKLTGVPSSFTPSAHVHAGTDITTGVVPVARLGSGTPGSSNYLRGDGAWTVPTVAQVTGAVPDTRQVIAGAGLTGGGALSANVTLTANTAAIQTPWTQAINGGGFALSNVASVSSSLLSVAPANGASAVLDFALDKVSRHQVTAEYATKDLSFSRFNASGGYLSTPFRILGATNAAQFDGAAFFVLPANVSMDTAMPIGSAYFAWGSNTQFVIRVKGSDGVVRAVAITVA